MKTRKLSILVIIFLITLQIWYGYLNKQHPYLGVNLELSDQNWVVSSLDPSSAHGINVKVGDVVIKVNEQDPGLHFSVAKWRVIEQCDSFELIRNGNEHIVISTSQVKNSLSHDILPMLAVVISFLSAYFLYFKVRKSNSSELLSLVFLFIGMTFMSLGASVRGDTIGKLIVVSSMSLLPFLFLKFVIAFFKEKGNIVLNSKFILPSFTFVFLQFFIICVWYFRTTVNYTLYKLTSLSVLLIFSIGTIWIISVLLRLYFQYRKEQSYIATIIRVVIYSIMISFFPVVCLSFVPRLFNGYELLPSYYTSWFVLFFPLAFAYLIISKKLYDIDVLLRRIFFTLIMSIAPSLIITTISCIFFYDNFSFRKSFFLFVTYLIVLTFVLYSVEHMYTRLERFMFPRKHLLQAALKKISKDLTSTFSFRELKDLILLDIVNTLQVYGGAIVFKYRDSTEIISEGIIDQAEIERLIGQDGSDEDPDLMRFEINRHEEYTSFLVMTRKKSNTRLGLEEVQWLNLIISYLAVSLENVYLIRKLTDKLNSLASHLPGEQGASDFNWFRKLSFELQERERVRIATDLHDTTMQDLFFLKRKLKALGEKHALSTEVNDGIQSLIEYIEIINVNLRQNCFDLHPYLLQEIGLVRTIEKIVERESYSCPFQIRFDAVGVQMIERKDLEFKRHLFRIVQELLNNAKKHSEATLVSIRLTASMGYYMLHYRDDGVGFDPSKLAAPDMGTSGVGMEQLRSRILHMEGHLDLAAARGSGVDIRISFPMKEGLTA